MAFLFGSNLKLLFSWGVDFCWEGSTEGEFFKVGEGNKQSFGWWGGTPPISSSPPVGKTLKDNVPG